MQPLSSRTRNRHGFTLVELLCVVAIVTLLALMLVPVFARARERARRPDRMAGTRALGMALELYAQDYGEDGWQAAFQAPTGCAFDSGTWSSTNGGCEDLLAGLVWSRTSDETTGYYNRVWSREASPGKIAGAQQYCRDLVEGSCPDQPGGLCADWRLPTNTEVQAGQAHLIGDHVVMRYPTTWRRWTGASYTQGKTLYGYMVYLGTQQPPFAVVAMDKNGNYPNAGDTICVRSP